MEKYERLRRPQTTVEPGRACNIKGYVCEHNLQRKKSVIRSVELVSKNILALCTLPLTFMVSSLMGDLLWLLIKSSSSVVMGSVIECRTVAVSG